jgi:pimeloyl-ACP methyl ester carboxylesterase
MTERSVPLSGVTLNVAECIHNPARSRENPTLLMLHGVSRRWQTYVPLFPAFSFRWNVLAVDFRGHGESTPVPGRYHVIDYVDDIVELVTQELHSGRLNGPIAIYGHSLGAMVAAGAASRLGTNVSAVVLEDPPLHTMGENIHGNILLSLFRGMQQFAGDARSVREIATDLSNVLLHDPENGKTIRLGTVRDTTTLRFSAAALKLVDRDVFSPIVSGEWLKGYDVETVFSNLHCPALLLQADPAAGGMLMDQDASLVSRLAADLSLVRFQGTGHMIHSTRTTDLVNMVHSFLESVR